MQDFEIRILNFDGTLSLITQSTHLNSLAAISSGKRLAGSRPFEVWCAERCLYTSLAPPPMFDPPKRPAA